MNDFSWWSLSFGSDLQTDLVDVAAAAADGVVGCEVLEEGVDGAVVSFAGYSPDVFDMAHRGLLMMTKMMSNQTEKKRTENTRRGPRNSPRIRQGSPGKLFGTMQAISSTRIIHCFFSIMKVLDCFPIYSNMGICISMKMNVNCFSRGIFCKHKSVPDSD